MENYSDPYKNWVRLKQTQQFLQSGMLPHDKWYKEHYKHLTMYANVLRATEDWDQSMLPIMERLISDYEETGYYSLKEYKKVVDQLIHMMDDHEMSSIFNKLGF